MSRQEKLLQRFKTIPADFSWSELQRLLAGFGYELSVGGRTGGSRIRFIHADHPPIILHKPHPTPLLKRYQLVQILEFLKKEAIL